MPGIGNTAGPRVAEVVMPFLMGIVIVTFGTIKIINAIKTNFKDLFLFTEHPDLNNGHLY
jgi:hypothetical protein